ncbi:CPBP family intramembrane glutamic endopeptidase [Deinococcus apachensis]|uniref:CPBP family intramembrane glutamic endopeptidase n=1 Tax=Deinococcus apachensis TaxID=309886 RepID=UPI00037E1453|nr:CPBP family intramembrane glutamic endopeptidase [Deinococcus apachensis]
MSALTRSPYRPWAYSPWPFFLLTYLFSWTCFGIVLALRQPVSFTPPSPALLLSVLGDFGPFVAATLLTTLASGRQGLRALLVQLKPARLPLPVVLVSALSVPLLVTAANLLSLASGGAAPRHWLHANTGTLVLLFAFVLFGVAEQTGWRGYAQPRLNARYGPLVTSVVLGVLWATWHLPLFWVTGSGQYGQAFAPYVLEVVGWSFLMSWVWERGGGRVLPCVLLHFSINVTAVTLGTGADSAEWRSELWGVLMVALAWVFRRSPQASLAHRD